MSVGVRLYERSSAVESTRVGDRVVLYHRDTRIALVLNPTGTSVWEALARPDTTRGLAQALRTRFPALDEHDAVRDVSALLEELLARGAISTAG